MLAISRCARSSGDRRREAIVTLRGLRIVVCRTATVSAPRTASAGAGLRAIAREFPTIAVRFESPGDRTSAPRVDEAAGGGDARDVTIDVASWNDGNRPFDPFDELVEPIAWSSPTTLVVDGSLDASPLAALEMLTRWQWLIGRRNTASAGSEFDAVLSRLAALHDLDKPLVRADYTHALDTWQWLLRLDPAASAATQMAALLHDVERLESEADKRIEHRAPDYLRFKESHARRGALIADGVLDSCGIGGAIRERAVSLVAEHESQGDDPDRASLNDADALSFFSRNSAGYADYFGEVQLRRKIAYTLRRMRPSARGRLATVRLRDDVGRALVQVEGDGTRAVGIGVGAGQ
jgi:hypothetical protein